MNVKDASTEQIMKNAEITNLKKILGLENRKGLQGYKVFAIWEGDDYDGSRS